MKEVTESALRKAFRQANWQALTYPTMEYSVYYSPEERKLYTKEYVCGSNSTPLAVWEGRDICLRTISHPFFAGNAPRVQRGYLDEIIDWDVSTAMADIAEADKTWAAKLDRDPPKSDWEQELSAGNANSPNKDSRAAHSKGDPDLSL